MTPVKPLSPLLIDLYELTMAAAYFDRQMDLPATFSLFLRHDPRRGYFVSAGLAPALELLASFCFEKDDIAYLRKTDLFLEQKSAYRRTPPIWIWSTSWCSTQTGRSANYRPGNELWRAKSRFFVA
jgi:nicotinic acid phosphoribosyltransferase